MKGLKKFLAVSAVAVAVLGLATTASAAKPKIAKEIVVNLVREKASLGNKAWKAEADTALVAFRNLKWNAKITDVTLNNSKICLEKRAVGAYHLNICPNKYIKPGDTTKAVIWVKQNGEYYKLKTTVRFAVASSPVTIRFAGNDELGDPKTYTFDSVFAGNLTHSWTRPISINEMVVTVTWDTANQNAGKIYGYLKDKCDKEVRLYNGNMYELKKFSAIKVTYTTPLAKTPTYIKNFFKVENDSFSGTKKFPVSKSVVLNIG